MSDCRVWIRLNLPTDKLAQLHDRLPGCDFVKGRDADVAPEQLPGVNAIFTDDVLTDELIERMPNLRWIHSTRGGVYNLFSPAVVNQGIQIISSKGIHGPPFCQFALACMFALASKIPQICQAQTERHWERLIQEPIWGKTVGILGLGTIGNDLAQKSKALGFRVVATKRTVDGKPPYVDELGPPEDLPEMLAESDFVVICLPSIPATANTIVEKDLRLMKPTAYLINLVTGRAIDEDLLVRCFKEHWIAGGALDAFPSQPLPEDSELWGLPNVIISPRMGGLTPFQWDKVLPILIDNLERFQAGKPLRNVVDKDIGY